MASTHQILDDHHVDRSLVADIDIPVLTGLQRQGDVLVAPARGGKEPGLRVPAEGVPVVRGEAGGNTHLLVAVEGAVTWRAAAGGGQLLGAVTVPDGGVAGLLHPEHGATLIGPGSYVVRRQREQADEIRLVAD